MCEHGTKTALDLLIEKPLGCYFQVPSQYLKKMCSEKNVLKPLKITISWHNFHKFLWATPKTKNNFIFAEITKLNHKFQTPFILSKYHVLAELLFFYFVMGFLLDIVIFSHNSCA